MMSRHRIRYGPERRVCTNNSWWRQGQYNSATNTFTRNGETFEVVSGDTSRNHQWIRFRQFWVDTYQEPYWDLESTDHSVEGAQVAQTWLQRQDGWLSSIGLYFTRLAGNGNIHVAICEATNGAPDPSKIIMKVNIDHADLKAYPTATKFTIPPTYMEAGKRYAALVITNAAHYVAMAEGNAYAGGTFFYTTDGDYHVGDLTKDMMLDLYFAQFHHPRVVVDMQPLNLDGGIADIDLLASLIAPASTELTYEIDAGNGWIPISKLSLNALIGLPPLVKLRLVFLGTTDIMPGIRLSGSQAKVSRARTNFLHISKVRTLAGNATKVTLLSRLEGWSNNHTLTCKLDVAGTLIAPNVTETKDIGDGAIELRSTFNLDNPVDHYIIRHEGLTTSALDVFHVAERVDVAV